jgi:hypothetical protein
MWSRLVGMAGRGWTTVVALGAMGGGGDREKRIEGGKV